MTVSTDRIVKIPKPVSAKVRSPTWIPCNPNGAGKERKSDPKTMAARACRTVKRPSVRMTALMGDLPSTGRTTTRSTTAPSTKPETRATGRAIQ